MNVRLSDGVGIICNNSLNLLKTDLVRYIYKDKAFIFNLQYINYNIIQYAEYEINV